MDNQISLKILGEGKRKTLVATRKPLELILLNSVNALVEPHLLPTLARWMNSTTLKEAADELGTSIYWCHKFKKEIVGGEDESSGFPKIHHQLIGKKQKKGQLLIITNQPIKFSPISGIRGAYEEGTREELVEFVSVHKIKEFSSKCKISESTTKRLRKSLGITRKKQNKEELDDYQLIKLSD